MDWKEKVESCDPSSVDRDGFDRSAVIVPVIDDDPDLSIIFTRRADHLPNHAGEMSFPGGGMEDFDVSLRETAVREMWEEVGVEANDLEVVGRLDDTVTVTSSYSITPFVANVPYPYDFEIHDGEVDELVVVPLKNLLDPDVHEVRRKDGYPVHYFYYDDYTIWGATAEILVGFLDVLDLWPLGD
ncbi:MAG: CoA pyrophosphatase [Halobacteria archaeon]